MTREPLIAKILAEPDDDGPRLVYADWLEEAGESDRAKFIRVQCELASLSSTLPPVVDFDRPGVTCEVNDGTTLISVPVRHGWDWVPKNWSGVDIVFRGTWFTNAKVTMEYGDMPRMRPEFGEDAEPSPATVFTLTDYVCHLHYPPHRHHQAALRRRERELLSAACVSGGKSNCEYWFSPFDEDFTYRSGSFGDVVERAFAWTYHRGFVETLTSCSWQSWTAHADTICAAAPVRTVRLTTVPELRNSFDTAWYFLDGSDVRLRYDQVGGPPFGPVGGAAERITYKLLAAEWPGIAFELPPATPLYVDGRAVVAQLSQALQPIVDSAQALAQSFRITAEAVVEAFDQIPAPAQTPTRRRNSRRPDWLDNSPRRRP